jgi:hypothetical protein
MIFGRATNLWIGLVSALSGAVSLTAILVFNADAEVVGPLAAVWQGVLGTVVILVANQPPTVKPGDEITIQTPKGQENVTQTVAV